MPITTKPQAGHAIGSSTVIYPRMVRRDGSDNILIRCYAPGDGHLSFIAYDQRTGAEVLPGPTRDECLKVCPIGWDVYATNSGWLRAMPSPLFGAD